MRHKRRDGLDATPDPTRPLGLGRKSRKTKPRLNVIGRREFARGVLREQFDEDSRRNQETQEPHALMRDPKAAFRNMRRLLQFDHEKVDASGADDWDVMCDMMGQDPIVNGAVQQLATSVNGVELLFDADSEEDAERAREQWDEGSPLRNQAVTGLIQNYTSGSYVAERLWERTDDGWDWPTFRRLPTDAYRAIEDPYGQVEALEIQILDGDGYPIEGGGHQLWPQYVPTKPWTLTRDGRMRRDEEELPDFSWDDYLILRYPETETRARGRGAFLRVVPEFYFSLHISQWLKVLTERHGLPAMLAFHTGAANGLDDLLNPNYAITEDKVFKALREMQTAYRALLPPGYDMREITTNAAGLADMLMAILEHNRSRIEVGIIYQQVTSGAAASLGTKGANESVSNTFLRLVRDMQFMLAGLINRTNDATWRVNARPYRPAPKASFEDPDPAAEQLKFERLRAAVQDGVAAKEDPMVIAAYGLDPYTDDRIEVIRKSRAMVGAIGGIVPDMSGATGGSAQRLPGDILADFEDGLLLEKAARFELRQGGATADEINDMIAESLARVQQAGVAEPTPTETTGDSTKALELTPSDLATITTVNEGRASAGLGPLRLLDGSIDPDGELTISEFRAKREAKGDVEGETEGEVESGAVTGPADTSPQMNEARAIVSRAIDKLGAKFADYDLTRQRVPITSQLEEALEVLGVADARGTSRLWGEALQGWLGHRLPVCEDEFDRRELVEELRRYVSGDLLEGVK